MATPLSTPEEIEEERRRRREEYRQEQAAQQAQPENISADIEMRRRIAREQYRTGQVNQTVTTMRVAERINQTDASRALELSRQFDVPFNVALSNLDRLREEPSYRAMEQVLDQYPVTMSFLQRAENAAVVQQDWENLIEIERQIADLEPRQGPAGEAADFGRSLVGSPFMFAGRTVRGFGEALSVGEDVLPTLAKAGTSATNPFEGLALLAERYGITDRSFEDINADATRFVQDRVFGEGAPLSAIGEAVSDASSFVAEEAVLPLGGGLVGVGEFIQPDEMGFADQVADALGQIVTAVALSRVPGGRQAAAGAFTFQGIDQQAQAMRAAGRDPGDLVPQLLAGGAVTGISEKLRLNRITRLLPPSARQAVTGRVISRILDEAAEEAVQEGIENVGQNVVTLTYDESANIFEGLPEAMTVAGTSAAIFQTLVEVLLPGKQRRDATEQLQEQTQQIHDVAAAMNATQISRGTVEDFINQASGQAEVFVSSAGVVSLYQSEGGPEALQSMGFTDDQVANAIATGSDLTVSVGRLTTASPDSFSLLQDHIRVSPDHPTGAELAAGAMSEELDADAREAVMQIARETMSDQEVAEVQAEVARELEQVGRSADEARQAGVVYGAFFRTLANITGRSVREVFEEGRARIVSGLAVDPQNPAAQTFEQFAGVNALTADTDALAQAESRLEAGEDAELVRQETGWFRGVDGNMRFEISDSAMRPVIDLEEGNTYQGPLGEIIQHDALFEAYPNLRNMPVRIAIGGRYNGAFDGRSLFAQGQNVDEALGVVVHEIQHAIQRIEGFARGGSVAQQAAALNAARIAPGPTAVFTGPLRDALRARVNELIEAKPYGDRILAVVVNREIGDPMFQDNQVPAKDAITQALESREVENPSFEAADLLSEINETQEYQAYSTALQDAVREAEPFTRLDPNVPDNAFILYRRLAGEVEARDTEARRGLIEASRQRITPESIQVGDSPIMVAPFTPEQQIVQPQEAQPLVFNQAGLPLFGERLIEPGEGSGRNGKIKVVDVGQALTDQHMALVGRKLFPEDAEADHETVMAYAREELAAQLNRPNSGVGWYSADVEKAVNDTALVFPTLLTEPGHRDLYLTFAAIFSTNTDPDMAWIAASNAFEQFLRDGEIPVLRRNADGSPVAVNKETGKPVGWTNRSTLNEQQLAFVKYLVEREGGLEAGIRWLTSRQSRADIDAAMLDSNLYKAGRFKTKKALAGAPEYGFLVFGPKLGRYAMGLYGVDIDAGDTTIDMWYTRTFRRWTGRLMDGPLGPEGVAAQPRNDKERDEIFRITGELAEEFDMDPGDVQAVLWFFEKRLYGSQGLRFNEGTNSAGAARLLKQRGYFIGDDGAAGSRQAGGAGAARTLNESQVRVTPNNKAEALEAFIAPQAQMSLDEIYEIAPEANAKLNADLGQIAADLGLEHVAGPMKRRDTAEDKMRRKAYKNPGQLNDIARGTLLIETPQQYLQVIDALRRNYDIMDEGWRMPDPEVGYYDAKMIVRFPSGLTGEVQLMPTGMFEAKHRGEGHRLYETFLAGEEVLSKAEIAEAKRDSYDLYRLAVLRSPLWSEIFDMLAAASGNISANRVAEMTLPLSMTSPGSTRSQAASENMNASSASGVSGNVTTAAGLASQSYSAETSMGSPSSLENVNDPPTIINRQELEDDTETVRGAPARRNLVRGRVAEDARTINVGEGAEVFEISDAEVFKDLIQEAKDALGEVGAQVHVYDDYAGKRLFLMNDGLSGFALDGDDIVSVFSHPDAPAGMVKRAFEVAVALGGLRLDAFDTFLPKVYARAGFRAVAQLPFNREFAPDGWDYDFFSTEFPQTGGEPPVIFMVYDPDNAAAGTDNVVEEYDDGVAAQDLALSPAPAGEITVNGRTYGPRREGETLKEYMKREIDTRPQPDDLPFAPERFFDLSGQYEMVRMGRIQSSKTAEENRQGGGNAAKRFLATYDGILDPREPITVRRNDDGGFTIVDGNGTFTAFQNYGWEYIPVRVEGQTFDQSATTDTQAFRDWFGDSKVVDSNGEPLVVYHGTRQPGGVETLDAGMSRAGLGVYVTPNREFAEEFTEGEGEVIAGYLAAEDLIDLRDYGPFVDREDVRDIADSIDVDPDDLEASWDSLSRAGGDVFMFNLLEAGNFELADGQAVRFEDWGEGSAEDAIVFSGEAKFKSVNNRGTFDPADPRLLNQGETSGPRGQVDIPAAGVLDGQAVIRLTESADFSTFMHESAHLFFEIYREYEGRGYAEIDEVMADIRSWLGMRPGEAPTRDQHEKLAESFETYLVEGKAPAPELKTAFRRFRKWITDVYRNLRGQLRELEPEAIQIFDKMLAGDAEVGAQELQAGRSLTEAMRGIMTEKEIARHERLTAQAGERARNSMFDKISKAIARRNRREVATRIRALRDDARAELAAAPLHKTTEAIFNGNMPQLNRAAAEAVVGKDVLARLPRGKRGLLTDQGGETDLETFAELQGFNSASGMLNEIAGSQTLRKAAHALAERRAEDEGLSLMTDEEVAEAANAAIHSDGSAQILEAQLNALSRKAAIKGIPVQALKAEAKRRVEGDPIEDVMKPGIYAIQSRSLHKKAMRLAAQENWAEAMQKMQQALYQHEMARLAYKARDEVARGQRRVARFNPSRKLDPKRYDPEIIDLIHRVFRLPGANDATERQGLRAWVEANPEIPALLPNSVWSDRPLPDQRGMSLTEFREWRDSLLSLGKAARDRSEMERAKRAQANTELAESIKGNAGNPHKESAFGEENAKSKRGVLGFLRSGSASIRRLSYLGRIMDGGPDAVGLFFDRVVEPLRQASNAELDLRAKNQDWMEEWFAEYGNALNLGKSTYSDALGGEVTRELIFAVILNTGNESNLERLYNERREGAPRFTPEIVQAVLDEHGTPEVMAAAQAVWDYIDSYWPEIAALERRTTGVALTKVEPSPVTARGQRYRGGYYPIAYDPFTAEKGAPKPGDDPGREFEASLDKGFGGVLSRAQTKHGHTQARETTTGRQLHLSMSVLWRHLDSVAHDLAFREAFQQVGGTVTDPQVSKAIIEAVGLSNAEAINEIILRTGTGKILPRGPVDQLFKRLRVNAVAAMLGASLRTVMTQPFGLAQSYAKLGTKRMTEAIAQHLANPAKSADFAMSNSPFMRERARVITRDVKDALLGEQARGLKNKLTGWALIPMQFTDTYGVAIPTWLAAYNEGIESRNMSHEKAARYADQIVADTQGSGETMDLSTLQSGTEMEKLFTFMFGYFSGTLNLTFEGVQNIGQGRFLKGTLALMMIHVVQGALSEIVLNGLSGDEDEDDLEVRLMKTVAMGTLNQFSGSVPLVREAMSGIMYGNTQATPLGRAGDQAVRSVQSTQSLVEALLEGDAEAEHFHRLVKDGARMVGLWYGVPGTYQAARMYDTIMMDDDPTVMEVFLTGKDQDN